MAPTVIPSSSSATQTAALEEALPRLPNSKIDKQALKRRLENLQET